MGFISSASGNSIWRGHDYFTTKRVLSINKISKTEFEGIIQGSKQYHVKIDIDHPRKSSCDCPHAAGKRIICKHMVALYFEAFPKEAKKLLKASEEYEKEEEERWAVHLKEIRQDVYSLSKKELQERLMEALVSLEETGRYGRY